MKNFGLLCAVVIAAASASHAMENAETLRLETQSAFERLASIRLEPKATRLVNLSGNLSMDGSGFVNSPRGGSVTITLNGSTSLSGSDGLTANASFTETQTFFVNGNFVSGYIYPRQYVQVYRAGRSVGLATVSGSIYVSGFVSGNWLRLSGSGQVSGSGSVQDLAAPARRF